MILKKIFASVFHTMVYYLYYQSTPQSNDKGEKFEIN